MACGRRTISISVNAPVPSAFAGEVAVALCSTGRGTTDASDEGSSSLSVSMRSASKISASKTSSSSISSSSEEGSGTGSIGSSSSRDIITGSSAGSSSLVEWNVEVASSNTSIPRVSLSTPESRRRANNSAFFPLAERSLSTQSALSFATVNVVVGSLPMVIPHQTVGMVPFKAGVDLMMNCINIEATLCPQPS